MDVTDDLQKLEHLRDAGALTDAEYASARARILGGHPESYFDATTGNLGGESGFGFQVQQTRQWGMFLHLSVLAGYVVPVAGLVAPILIWQLKKDELPGLDQHGKNALNWIISEIIYAVFCALLVFVLIGIPLLIALTVLGMGFPIIAGIKANNGEVWKYPLAIEFLK